MCLMVEIYRIILETWFDEKRTEGASRDHDLTANTYAKLNLSVQAGLRLQARGNAATHVYKVEKNKITYKVDLMNWTCGCREFDSDLIPCRHAVAAIRYMFNFYLLRVLHYFN